MYPNRYTVTYAALLTVGGSGCKDVVYDDVLRVSAVPKATMLPPLIDRPTCTDVGPVEVRRPS